MPRPVIGVEATLRGIHAIFQARLHDSISTLRVELGGWSWGSCLLRYGTGGAAWRGLAINGGNSESLIGWLAVSIFHFESPRPHPPHTPLRPARSGISTDNRRGTEKQHPRQPTDQPTAWAAQSRCCTRVQCFAARLAFSSHGPWIQVWNLCMVNYLIHLRAAFSLQQYLQSALD